VIPSTLVDALAGRYKEAGWPRLSDRRSWVLGRESIVSIMIDGRQL
jgi:hypothetical protein